MQLESLLLSHLPLHLMHHSCLEFLKDLSEPPKLSVVAKAFCEAGKAPDETWQMLHTANKKAQECALQLKAKKVFVVDYWSIHYPLSLRWIDSPPWNIFYVGNLPSPCAHRLAIIGTRRPNRYGIEVVQRILPQLETRPLQIISGFAHGIDAQAHSTACELQIPNFAVLGSGVDVLYPQNHQQLADKVLKVGGGLLSEFPLGTPPLHYHFPFRNRIIAALSHVIWVVQATIKSGTKHTAVHALTQGRAVIATPGDIFSEYSQLGNELIADGAHVLSDASDIDLLLAKEAGPIAAEQGSLQI